MKKVLLLGAFITILDFIIQIYYSIMPIDIHSSHLNDMQRRAYLNRLIKDNDSQAFVALIKNDLATHYSYWNLLVLASSRNIYPDWVAEKTLFLGDSYPMVVSQKNLVASYLKKHPERFSEVYCHYTTYPNANTDFITSILPHDSLSESNCTGYKDGFISDFSNEKLLP